MTLLRERLFHRLRHLQLPAAELVILVRAREHSIGRKEIVESWKLVLLPLNGLGGSGHCRVTIILATAILAESPIRFCSNNIPIRNLWLRTPPLPRSSPSSGAPMSGSLRCSTGW